MKACGKQEYQHQHLYDRNYNYRDSFRVSGLCNKIMLSQRTCLRQMQRCLRLRRLDIILHVLQVFLFAIESRREDGKCELLHSYYDFMIVSLDH